jgi:branched-subunit amino acid transport protein
MSVVWLWLAIIVIGLLTLGIRLSFIVFLGKIQVASIVQQGLRFVPIAVLSALISPALFFPAGSLDLSLSNARLIAGIVAIIVAWRTKNVLLTIFVGMACLLILQFVVLRH